MCAILVTAGWSALRLQEREDGEWHVVVEEQRERTAIQGIWKECGGLKMSFKT